MHEGRHLNAGQSGIRQRGDYSQLVLGRDKRILELKSVAGPDLTELDAIG
jgi:hypothetical protein